MGRGAVSKPEQRRSYFTVDVFTDRAFGGNPLAVVVEAEGLSTAQMAAIAREFNYSETTFVQPPSDPAHTAKVRIFTPAGEIAFAGHPNVGTAFVLACEDAASAGDCVLFEEKAGLVPIDILRKGDTIVGARLTAPQPLTLGPALPPGTVAACGGLDAADLTDERHPPRSASTGMPFAIAELVNIDALRRARPKPEAFAALAEHHLDAVLFYVPTPDAAADVQVRMFAPPHGVPEDPATGSAAAALVGLLASLESATDGIFTLRIAQGTEVGRPSLLLADASRDRGRLTRIRVSGDCVMVMSGELRIP